MTSTDRNDLVPALPAQMLLEWVTPKISLMGAEDTEGKLVSVSEFSEGANTFGPS